MGQTPGFRVEVDRSRLPRAVIITVAGELDYDTSPRLLDAAGGPPPAGASLIIDAHELAFCDSSALGAMINLRAAATGGGGRLYVTGVQPQVLSAIRVTSLDELLMIRDDVPAALAELDSR
ncbi:STAS domain-containing protein [Actinoplanes sp. NPDC051633]|uniref:STAS domain-containing protein n=1 Tax=Actinoplanes sp. NPDC051633 TaxID=3155670 RepID=UPI00343CF4A7